jgi:uncharacterized protein YjhX (UPF0386 family)/archaellum biogenesis ATPase FlaH
MTALKLMPPSPTTPDDPLPLETTELILLHLIERYPHLLDSLDWLQPYDFQAVWLGWAFQAARSIRLRGEVVTTFTITNELRTTGKDVPIEKLATIYNPVPGRGFFEDEYQSHANTIKEESRYREADRLGDQYRAARKKGDTVTARRAFDQIAVLAADEYPGNAPAATKRFELTKTRDVLTRPKPTWLYPGEIPSSALVTVTGASGNGKTFVTIDYAMRIAQQHRVIYVAAERPYAALMRGVAWLDHYQATDKTIHDDNLAWIETPLDITDPATVRAISDQAQEFGAECIIFDTFSRCAETIEENSPSEMKRVMGAFDAIKTATGAAVVVVHHTGWSGGRERGGSPIRDYAEVAILVEMEDRTIKISCNKMSSADEFKPRTMTIIPVGEQPADEAFGPACVIPATTIIQTKLDKLSKGQAAVLEVLALEIYAETGARASEIIRDAKIPDGSSSRVFSQLKKLGYLRQSAGGQPYFITSEGRQKLAEQSKQSRSNHDGIDGSAQPHIKKQSIAITPLRGDGDDGSDGSANKTKQKTVTVDLPASVDAQKEVAK